MALSTFGSSTHDLLADRTLSWASMNQALHDIVITYHEPSASTLVLDAHAIQHIIRTNVIPKASDKIHFTPLISMVTYFVIL